jgi:E3 ubiquitin-protein ligase NEDD4
MLHKKVILQDMEGVDVEFYRSLQWTIDNDINGILDLTFSAEEERFGELVTVDLKPGGRDVEVTNENKKEYVELITEWKIQKCVEEQFKAFMDGFNELVPEDLVNVFDERELELLIGGIAEIDVEDWKKHTDYRGFQESDEAIQWFWKCVSEWDNEQRARLLQFTTGTSRIPVNGFKDLQGSDGPRRFTIEKAGEPNQLPKSHTCFNRVDLPPYNDYGSLKQKLNLAVEETVGFGQE